MRNFFILFIALALVSCAQSPKEEVDNAISVALSHLSKSECEKALKALQETNEGHDNAVYLEVLASAYACRAGYTTIGFIESDLPSLNTGSLAAIFSSIATTSLSVEAAADAEGYAAVKTGLQVLFQSSSPSGHLGRVGKFGNRKAGDMSVQALLLSVVNLGKFLNWYGNVDDDGDKGAGTGTNSCFLDYSDSRARTVVDNAGGNCSSYNDGHPDLSLAASSLAVSKRRLCEGLMLVTNIMDILENLDLSGNSALSQLDSISTHIGTLKSAAVTAGLGTLINMTSQSACEAHLNTASHVDDMQYMYSLIFEANLQ